MAQITPQSPGGFHRYRWTELGMFILPIIMLLLEMTQLLLAKLDPASTPDLRKFPIIEGLTPILGLIAALLLAHVVLNIFFRKTDQFLLPLVGLLSGLGVLMATRLGPSFRVGDPALGNKQLIWVLIGLIFCLGTMFALRNIHWLARYKYTAALFGVILFCTTLVNALHSNLDTPTHDQLKLGLFAFQPSELLKICIVIFFAAYLSENRDVLAEGGWRIGRLRLPPLRQLGPLALMLFISLILFLVVRELGLALLIYGIFLSMIYLGTNKLIYVLVSIGVAVLLGFVGFKLLPYVRQRFAVVGFDVVNWQNWSKADDYFATNAGNQVVQGLIAVSSGGILGAGFGLGHPGYVPVVQSDMVFTAFAEEFGLMGLFALMGIYLFVLYRGFRIAIEATDTFSKLLAAGLTSIFAIQTLIISAGNLKLMPLTGIPLPFLSYGGSSVIGNFIIIGILLRISYNTALERDGIG
ncbi:MAG TPA: FtsW/RodA/SpoVE family cell cycle protein [Ktedonobacteraceae bacterium]|nr:FtsW/RodA/SpoVE family cell cycle protein [Ktedonobacteraceae bacterium]